MFDLAAFKRIVVAAALAGLLAGMLLTAVQQIQVIPLLLEAEMYEEAAVASLPSHSHASTGHDARNEHEREYQAWQPANGWERTLSAAVANIVLAIGFGLLLGSAMCLRGRTTSWHAGLLWGAAGYVVFFVAPSLGLPPELPGTEAARLADRQLWWLMTVVLTGTGLSILAFSRMWVAKLLGALLLGVPHLIGVPQPQIHGGAVPVELANAFVWATSVANAVFWLFLGALLGFFYKRLA